MLFKKLNIPDMSEKDEVDMEEKSSAAHKESAMGGMTGEDSDMVGEDKF